MSLETKSYIWLGITILIGAAISILAIINDIKKENKVSRITWIIILLIIVYTIADFYKSRIDNKNQEKDKVEVIDAINETHDLIGVKEFPGFTITVLVSIEQLEDKRRKFILDIGDNPNNNRVSLYLDYNNNLVYSIFDADGVPHTIKVPQRIYTFEFNTFYFIHCEFGDTKDFNFMRLSINNTHFEPLKFNNKVNIPKDVYKNKGTIFTDIEKKEFSSMTISQYSIAHVTFTDKDKEKYMQIIDDYMKGIRKLKE